MFGSGKKSTPKAARRLPPTQEHVHVRAVADGVVVCDDGTLAKALEVMPVDLPMMGSGQRERYRLMFGRAIASIRAPLAIQIVIASRPQTCQEYLKRLKERSFEMEQKATLTDEEEEPTLKARRQTMADRAMHWAAFVETQLSYVRPLEQQYLVVVWHNPFPIKAKRRVLTRERFEKGKQELARRFSLVRSVFKDADLQVRPMDGQEMLTVIHRFYHFPLSPLGRNQEPRMQSMQSSLYVDVSEGD